MPSCCRRCWCWYLWPSWCSNPTTRISSGSYFSRQRRRCHWLCARSASYQKDGGYDHIRHARKLDRPGRVEGEGLATSSGRGEESSQGYERRVETLFPDDGRL